MAEVQIAAVEAARADSGPREPECEPVRPAHLHDDPLAECLAEVTRIHGVPWTPQALSAGLPLVGHRLTPALLPRAAGRAQFSARLLRRAPQE